MIGVWQEGQSYDRCVAGGAGDYEKMSLTLKLVCLTTGNMLMTSSSVNGCLVNKSYSLRNSCVPVGVKKSVGWMGRVWVDGEGVGGWGGCGWMGRVWVDGEGVGDGEGGGYGWMGRVWRLQNQVTSHCQSKPHVISSSPVPSPHLSSCRTAAVVMFCSCVELCKLLTSLGWWVWLVM